MNSEVLAKAESAFESTYGSKAEVVAYAPGRVEILGNHTDYNEGYVLSCAINFGTFFLASAAQDDGVSVTAVDVGETATATLDDLSPSDEHPWANYVKGVIAGVREIAPQSCGLNAAFFGDVPIGSGLSSSAALEISTGLAVAELWGLDVPSLDMARIGQKAEHDYAGAKCGLLDQISSLHGEANRLVMTDFRALDVKTATFSDDFAFVAFNTHAKHALVDGAYNERRESCEAAAEFFASVLPHDVKALRDVSMDEWRQHSEVMDKAPAMRSAHVIGECERVLVGVKMLDSGSVEDFGQLMYASHESSRTNFENSCPELDFIVDTAQSVPGVLGARLSGGGFGGSVIALVHSRDVATVSKAMLSAYSAEFGQECGVELINPSAGARVLR